MAIIKIDELGYFVSEYDESEIQTKPLEEILVGWDDSGGAAATGFDINPQEVTKIPSGAVVADLPEQKDGYKAKWETSNWVYINVETGEQYVEEPTIEVEQEPLDQQTIIEDPGMPF